MQFHGGAAVLQLVGFLHGGEGQLAFFADGHKAQTQLISHDRAENEATGIESSHHTRAQGGVHIAVHEGIDQDPEHARVLQQRRDVAKLHARRRPIGHGADVAFQIITDVQVVHGFSLAEVFLRPQPKFGICQTRQACLLRTARCHHSRFRAARWRDAS